jgi:hypothetical protein
MVSSLKQVDEKTLDLLVGCPVQKFCYVLDVGRRRATATPYEAGTGLNTGFDASSECFG